MVQSHFEKLIIAQLDKKFAAFYGARMVITAFTRLRHWIRSSARWLSPHTP